MLTFAHDFQDGVSDLSQSFLVAALQPLLQLRVVHVLGSGVGGHQEGLEDVSQVTEVVEQPVESVCDGIHRYQKAYLLVAVP